MFMAVSAPNTLAHPTTSFEERLFEMFFLNVFLGSATLHAMASTLKVMF